MQLRYEQLPQHLAKDLAPLYLLSGDVPLLLQEASESIHQAAKQQGYERQVFHVETGFSWSKFLAESNNLSLFANKQILELRLTSNQLGEGGSKALQSYANNPPPDKILVIKTGKLDSTQQKATWVQASIKIGVFMQFWPIPNDQLPQWIEKRLQAAGLRVEKAGIELLAANAEGNLLAAVQEIEKLRLLLDVTSQEMIKTETIAQAISDNARFDIFQLADVCLAGDRSRAIRVLRGLRSEGVEAILVLWALTREIRVLNQIAFNLEANQSLEQALQQQQVWEKRKPLVRQALKRHSTKSLMALLKQAGKIDQIIKGLEPGNVWDVLERLILKL